jgi:hypothetical protein
MAVRVQVVARAGTRYVQVVEDIPSESGWRVKNLQSFGAETPESMMRAHQWKSNYEAAKELAPQAAGDEEKEAALIAVFGIFLGAALLYALLGKK